MHSQPQTQHAAKKRSSPDDPDVQVEDAKEDEAPKKKKKVKEVAHEWQLLNKQVGRGRLVSAMHRFDVGYAMLESGAPVPLLHAWCIVWLGLGTERGVDGRWVLALVHCSVS